MSQRVIVDASATLAWLFNEPEQSQVTELLEQSEKVAPWLWQVEVVNALLIRQRRKLVDRETATRLLTVLDDLQVELIPGGADGPAEELYSLAESQQLTAYDAVYLRLAIRLTLPLLTLDHALRRAAERCEVTLANR